MSAESAPRTAAELVVLWRIAVDTPNYLADDLNGTGAHVSGGRWNRKGSPMVYTSTSRALARLETVVQLASGKPLPLNRYLVEVIVPWQAWDQREVLAPADRVGWDAQPPGKISLDWGTRWVAARSTLIAEVPSVIVPEESNLLINPRHSDIALVSTRKVRRWTCDGRLRP
ncbi:MAG: RES family NAD+ phosphorylase [Gemmatimonadaceae bacterium]